MVETDTQEVLMLYFTSKNIAVLAPFGPRERIDIIQTAASKMPFMRRAITTCLKAVLLIALFAALVYLPGIFWKVIGLLAAGIFYPLLLMPITLNMARPYLASEVAQRRLNNENIDHKINS